MSQPKINHSDKISKFILLEDGKYITNHFSHPDGVREREVKIENGSVVTDKFKFSQSSFFDVNNIVKKL